jgi:hypothetical protein
VRPMLGDLELTQVQEAALAERRALAEHRPPGLDGGMLQDLGRTPSRFTVWGVAAGPDAAGFIARLNERFREGAPLAFTADVDSGARVERVSIAGLRVEELAGKPDRWLYVLTLAEYQEPREPAATAAVDTDVLGEAEGLMDSLAGALDLAPLFVTGLEPFVGVLEGLLGRVRAFNQAAGTSG